MRRLVIATVVTAVFCAVSAANRVFACRCASGFAFAAYSQTDEIFTGRILSITRDPTTEFQREIVRVHVLDTLKGTAAGEVEIVSGAVCGFPFEQGREYLIYATYETDGLNVHLCNRTRTLDLASVDLSYIAGMSEGRSGVNVYGWATNDRTDRYGSRVLRTPVRLLLSGQGRQFEAALDEGKFEFHFVPPGSYTLSAIDAAIVNVMSSRSGGSVLHGIVVRGQTDVSYLAVTLRTNEQ